MFERTTSLLHSGVVVQTDDSCFAFGHGSHSLGAAGIDAVLAFFGPEFFAPSISGQSGHTLNVTRGALREIAAEVCHRLVVRLLEEDFHLFSVRPVTAAGLASIADAFMDDASGCRYFTNTSTSAAPRGGRSSAAWTPVTRSTTDMLVCAANERYVAYWVYSDDE